MMHQLTVLSGVALVLGAAVRIAVSTELGQGIISRTYGRFLLGGMLLTSSPGTVPLLSHALTDWAGPSFEGWAAAASTFVVASVIAVALPDDPGEYRTLLFAPEAGPVVRT